MNLHTEWQFNGQKAKCNLCGVVNVVPTHHYSATDGNARRLDIDSRPEYRKGTFEFKLP